MLKELNRFWVAAQRQAAAWRRWNCKLPHNRVRRPRLRDAAGRRIGYGPPVPVPEPMLASPFVRRVELPSGRSDVVLENRGIDAAYRLACRPQPTAAEVMPLALSEDEIRRMFEECCR